MNDLLNNYISIANMLVETFGEDCEVVIHDLTIPQESVVYTVNNHVTNRKVGDSFDLIISQVLLNQNFSNNFTANYYYLTKNNKLVKSSTTLIKNENNKVIGALCINIDTHKSISDIQNNNFAIDILQNKSDLEEKNEINLSEMETIEEIADDLIDQIIGDVEMNKVSREEKINIIRFMEEKSLFLIKGSIDKVANKLGVSTVTIYSYLDEIKKEKKQ